MEKGFEGMSVTTPTTSSIIEPWNCLIYDYAGQIVDYSKQINNPNLPSIWSQVNTTFDPNAGIMNTFDIHKSYIDTIKGLQDAIKMLHEEIDQLRWELTMEKNKDNKKIHHYTMNISAIDAENTKSFLKVAETVIAQHIGTKLEFLTEKKKGYSPVLIEKPVALIGSNPENKEEKEIDFMGEIRHMIEGGE